MGNFHLFKDTAWARGPTIACVTTGLWGAGTAPELGLGNNREHAGGAGPTGAWSAGESKSEQRGMRNISWKRLRR